MKNERGFSLVEVLVATMLISVALLGIAAVSLTAYTSLDSGGKRTVAVTLAQQRVEWMRNQGFNSVALSAGTTIENLAGIFDGYTRTSTIADNTPVAGVKQVTVTVAAPSGRNLQIVTLITD